MYVQIQDDIKINHKLIRMVRGLGRQDYIGIMMELKYGNHKYNQGTGMTHHHTCFVDLRNQLNKMDEANVGLLYGFLTGHQTYNFKTYLSRVDESKVKRFTKLLKTL